MSKYLRAQSHLEAYLGHYFSDPAPLDNVMKKKQFFDLCKVY